jgi:hypothetical protein
VSTNEEDSVVKKLDLDYAFDELKERGLVDECGPPMVGGGWTFHAVLQIIQWPDGCVGLYDELGGPVLTPWFARAAPLRTSSPISSPPARGHADLSRPETTSNDAS